MLSIARQALWTGPLAGWGSLHHAAVPRLFSSVATGSPTNALYFCVVGTGPAGFYVADKLLKAFGDRVRVDLIDRLPTPFGLVRSGVAPDHADTKNVINQFTATGKDPRVSFFGNVSLGKDVQLKDLRSLYHGVVLAYGAESDRKLGIPGENGKGVLSAREFVWWYNGHPDAKDLPIDLRRVSSVAVCGIGNVALDCARVLLQPPEMLAKTDIASHALDALKRMPADRAVHLVARRGPVQAACTPKELKELVTKFGAKVRAAPDQMAVSAADEKEMKAQRIKRRVFEIIQQAVTANDATQATPMALLNSPGSSSASASGARDVHFQFYRQPKEVLLDASGHVTGLRVEKTALKVEPGKAAVAVGTGQMETIPTQLVLVSIGYRSLPVEGAPFDRNKGIIPNTAGRVHAEAKAAAPSSAPSGAAAAATKGGSSAGPAVDRGLYVCGWLKRGPTGIIGTNSVDASETVESIQEDVAAGVLPAPARPLPGTDGLRSLLKSREKQAVDFPGWLRLDAAEVAAGQETGKVREKVVDVQQMLRLAGGAKA